MHRCDSTFQSTTHLISFFLNSYFTSRVRFPFANLFFSRVLETLTSPERQTSENDGNASIKEIIGKTGRRTEWYSREKSSLLLTLFRIQIFISLVERELHSLTKGSYLLCLIELLYFTEKLKASFFRSSFVSKIPVKRGKKKI